MNPAFVGLVTIVGAVAGTAFGTRLLRWLPERVFRRTVAALALALGAYMLVRGLA